MIVLAGWLRGNAFLPMLEVGISLAIAAVPEGLPAVATMTLAIGMQRMARMRALVRRLPAVETLGAVTVICTDKTGTLTRNEMTVHAIVLDGRRVEVTGGGYAPRGVPRREACAVDPDADPLLAPRPAASALCNDAEIDRGGGDSRARRPHRGGAHRRGGEGGPDERGLPARLSSGRRGPVRQSHQADGDHPPHHVGGAVAFVKGSPGSILGMSGSSTPRGGVEPLDEATRERSEANRDLAGAVLGCSAWRTALPDGLRPSPTSAATWSSSGSSE